eukprot:IDg13570t1
MTFSHIEQTAEKFISHRGEAAYDIKKLDKVFELLKSNSFELKFRNIDFRIAKVHTYAYASFDTNKDLLSKLGYVILLVDKAGNCSFLNWCSVKRKRVAKSEISTDLCPMAHAFDSAFTLVRTISRVVSRKIPMRIFKDSMTLFDSIVSFCSMTEKSILFEIFSLREACRNGNMAKLGWIRTQNSIADALTKDSLT